MCRSGLWENVTIEVTACCCWSADSLVNAKKEARHTLLHPPACQSLLFLAVERREMQQLAKQGCA